LTPEKIFDARWTVTLLGRAMTLLGDEYAAQGKWSTFETLKVFLRIGDGNGSQCSDELARKLADDDDTAIRLISSSRDGLGTTYHESGTLWMGDDPATSVTDTNGRFHHVANAYCVDQALFPTVGSANPVLTGLTLTRKIAEHIATLV